MILILLLGMICLGITACPQMMVKQIEEFETRSKDSSKALQYMNHAQSIADIEKAQKSFNKDSIVKRSSSLDISSVQVKSSDSSVKDKNAPVKAEDFNFRIIKVNSDIYPDSIEFRALITDKNGNYLTGLADPYLKNENDWQKYWLKIIDSCKGTGFVPSSFKVEEIRQSVSNPQGIAFVLDNSGSMGRTRIMMLLQATYVLLNALKPNDYASVIRFAGDYLVDVPLTNDRQKFSYDSIVNVLNEKKYKPGGTNIYDAIIPGIEQLASLKDKKYEKLIILFSDGEEVNSKVKIDSVYRHAARNKVAIYSICYGDGEEKTLRGLAECTGGRFYKLYSMSELSKVFKDIYLSVNNYYRITYKPLECPGLHNLWVMSALPELGIELEADANYDKSLIAKYSPPGTVIFTDIEFDFGKDSVKTESFEIIRQVAESMNNSLEMRIKVTGHTDDIGDDAANLKLSRRRAKSVKKKLIEYGIGENRITTDGMGESKPLAPNYSDENRRRNRRTEFLIIK